VVVLDRVLNAVGAPVVLVGGEAEATVLADGEGGVVSSGTKRIGGVLTDDLNFLFGLGGEQRARRKIEGLTLTQGERSVLEHEGRQRIGWLHAALSLAAVSGRRTGV